MQWFVQAPEYSFKGTFSHSILLVVFLGELATSSILVFMRCGAPAAHDVSLTGEMGEEA